MRRTIFITVIVIVIVSAATGFILSRGVQARDVVIHVKDLRQHGLIILDPTSASFDEGFSDLVRDRNSSERRSLDSLRAFSVFVRNTSERNVVAYKIRWELLMDDGRTINYETTRAVLGALMGDDAERVSSSRNVIRRNSARFAALGSLERQAQRGLGSSVGRATNQDDIAQIQQARQEQNENLLAERLSQQLSQATNITVSIDSAVFDDGTFVGPDLSQYFEQLRAGVTAKNDLLRGMLLALRRGESLDTVFRHVEAIATQERVQIRPDSTPDDYYNLYRRMYAEEVLHIRAAIGNDDTAMRYALQPLHRQWTRMRRRRR